MPSGISFSTYIQEAVSPWSHSSAQHRTASYDFTRFLWAYSLILVFLALRCSCLFLSAALPNKTV